MRIVYFISIFCVIKINAQSVSKVLGARSASMGYATSLADDEWSVFNNIAGLAGTKEIFSAASYEVKPALAAGNRYGALFSTPIKIGAFGIGAFHFGDELYNEQLLSVGFAHEIGNTSLGVRTSCIQYYAEGFGTHRIIGIDFGGITQLSKHLFIGAWIQNLNQPKQNNSTREKAPMKLFATIGFTPTEKFIAIAEVEKDIFYPVIWKAGMEYTIHKKLFARAGLNINPTAVSAGVGFKSWRIKIDYAFQGFSVVSSSHQASASFQISKVKPRK